MNNGEQLIGSGMLIEGKIFFYLSLIIALIPIIIFALCWLIYHACHNFPWPSSSINLIMIPRVVKPHTISPLWRDIGIIVLALG